MSEFKDEKPKIRTRFNVYGGNWVEIDVSEDIKTEVAVFRGTERAKASDCLKDPEIELFRTEEFDYEPKK